MCICSTTAFSIASSTVVWTFFCSTAKTGATGCSPPAISAEDPDLEGNLKAWRWEGPVWRLTRKMEIPAVDGPVAAFCGIARPHQFFDGLEAGGLQLAVRKAFPDHYAYTESDLDRLAKQAVAAGAVALVTTANDRVRLRKLLAGL